ncbi:MAG: histidine kinase dimerization/phospho-acceptor domain-containing protein [bacterium]
MVDVPDKQAGNSQLSVSQRSFAFVQGMGQVFGHSAIYGLSHSVTTKAMNNCFTILSEVLREKADINISIAEDELLVDGVRVEKALPAISAISKRLSSLSIASFSLTRGITAKELGNVFELLQATPDEMRAAGGFAVVISTVGLMHVRSKRVTTQQITEDEVVVSRNRLSEVVGKADIGHVVKFLKGEVDSSSPGLSEQLQACADDVQQVGAMVMQAVKQPGGSDPTESPDKIIAAVRRLYDSMSVGVGSRTQKGNRALVKFLEQLEGTLLQNMRKSHGGETPRAEAMLTQGLEEMKDELRIDSLAGEYARKRSAIVTSEKRILRYIESVGLDVVQKTGLKSRLIERGLTVDEWDDLLDKSGVGDNIAASADRLAEGMASAEVMTDLAKALSLLAAMGKIDLTASAPTAIAAADVDRVLVQVGEAVAKLVDQTDHKIEAFKRKVKERRRGKRETGISRKAIVAFLAEIVQELRQPLAVIMSVVDSMKSGMLGALSPQQTAMLGLAASSAERLDLLISKVADISGMPVGLSPDATILDAVYEGGKTDKL